MVKKMKFNQEPGALVQARLYPSLLDSPLPSTPIPDPLSAPLLCSRRGMVWLGQCI